MQSYCERKNQKRNKNTNEDSGFFLERPLGNGMSFFALKRLANIFKLLERRLRPASSLPTSQQFAMHVHVKPVTVSLQLLRIERYHHPATLLRAAMRFTKEDEESQ